VENENNSITCKFSCISDAFVFLFHGMQNTKSTSKDKIRENRKTRAREREKMTACGFV